VTVWLWSPHGFGWFDRSPHATTLQRTALIRRFVVGDGIPHIFGIHFSGFL
jgi:hypothetical protein